MSLSKTNKQTKRFGNARNYLPYLQTNLFLQSSFLVSQKEDTYSQCLPHARHFAAVISLEPHKNPARELAFIYLFIHLFSLRWREAKRVKQLWITHEQGRSWEMPQVTSRAGLEPGDLSSGWTTDPPDSNPNSAFTGSSALTRSLTLSLLSSTII